MPTTYAGSDSFPPSADLPNDGEDITFATFMAAVIEKLFDRTTYILNRAVLGPQHTLPSATGNVDASVRRVFRCPENPGAEFTYTVNVDPPGPCILYFYRPGSPDANQTNIVCGGSSITFEASKSSFAQFYFDGTEYHIVGHATAAAAQVTAVAGV